MNKNSTPNVQSSKIPSVIRFLFYILFFATPLIMYSGTSELFEFNKMLFIYAIATLVGALMISELILYNKKFYHHPFLTITFLLFLGGQILSTIFSIDVHTSLFGYYGRFNGGLFSIIAYTILFYAFINHFNLKSLEKLLKISLVTSIIVILWGIPGKFGSDLSCLLFTGSFNNSCWTDQFRPSERMFSTLGQPNWLGAYLAIHFFIGMYYVLKNKKVISVTSIILYIYLFLDFAAVLFTRSRSALGAVGISFAVLPIFLLLIYRKKVLHSFSIKIYGIAIALLIVSVLLFHTGIEKIDRYFNFSLSSKTISKQDSKVITPSRNQIVASGITDSFDIRKIVWKGAIDLGKKYPLFGTGVETFAYSYYFVRPVEHNLTSEWDFLYNKAHNEFLNYFATTGYTGLVTYLFMIASVFFLGLRYIFLTRNDKQEYKPLLISCLLLSYITILITNFFGFSTTTVNLFFYLIPAIILVINLNPDHDGIVAHSGSLVRNLLLVIPIAFTVYVFTFLFHYFTTDIHYSKAEQYVRSSEYEKAAENYSDMLKTHYEHVYEDKLSYVLANLVYVAAYQKEKDTASRLTRLAQYYNQQSILASPGNINYWKTTVKNDYLFYQSTQDIQYIQNGLDSLKKARKISPTDPKLPYSAALFYSLLEDEEKEPQLKQSYELSSLQSINDAIKLKSDYRDSYFLKAQLLKKYGKKEEARVVFNFILQHINPNDEEVKKEMNNL